MEARELMASGEETDQEVAGRIPLRICSARWLELAGVEESNSVSSPRARGCVLTRVCLTDWLTDWLADWLIGWLTDWDTNEEKTLHSIQFLFSSIYNDLGAQLTTCWWRGYMFELCAIYVDSEPCFRSCFRFLPNLKSSKQWHPTNLVPPCTLLRFPVHS